MMIDEKLKIIIWGENKECSNILDKIKIDELNDSKYKVVACCNNNHWLHGTSIDDIPFITPNDLLEMTRQNDNYLVVVAVDNNVLSNTISLLKQNGVNNVLPDVFLKSHKRNMRETLNCIQEFKKTKQALIVASPPKTGNVTLSTTLAENGINFIGFAHEPNRFNFFKNYDKIKVIVAVREPIIQNISIIYQVLSAPYSNTFNYHLRKNFKSKEHFTSNVQNIYPFFELYTKEKEKLWAMLYLDKFFNLFNRNIINLYEHKFDTEKGYAIIKEGNVEVFVYQLEKMNDIVCEMSNWIDQTPFDKWTKSNEASGKWIASSYKQAQKEITFSREYFEETYNETWVKHFYSDEDIAKFKAKWESHIKD